MTYVDAYYLRNKDKILVSERVNNERITKELDAKHVFYYEHPSGTHQTIFGDMCKKFETTSSKQFRKELSRISDPKLGKSKRIFESDINPVFRCLSDNYTGAATPNLNIAFFDIEVEFDPQEGFAPVTDPFNKINAISVYCKWLGRLITLGLCPPTLTMDEATAIGDQFQDTFIFDDEKELLKSFIDVLDDADCISGWNSTGFDIPYIVNRIIRILGEDYTRGLCLWDQKPIKRMYTEYKKERETYELVGRVHLDYLGLYKKHNPQQLHTYRLDYVGEVEIKENKIPYDGTLDDLYRKDYKKFLEYNRQDTLLLNKIDEKKKFIELANQIAHNNCVQLKTTMGSVTLVDQAIINEMHSLGFVVPNKKYIKEDDDIAVNEEESLPVCGAYVAQPKKGLHEHIGVSDINSLYPSAIRALNLSPETIVGHFRQDETDKYINDKMLTLTKDKGAEAWDGLFACLEYSHIMQKDSAPLTLDFEDGTSKTKSSRDWYEYIFNPSNQVCITANGTVFSTAKEGMIPKLLAKWYSERQEMQAKEAEFAEKAKQANDPDTKKQYSEQVTFWNQRQQARKILLNSLYGALLNEALRWYDARLGQSVTLSGRTIVKHMNSIINEIVTGEYDYKGAAIVYSDTDSSFFSPYEVLNNNPDYKDFEWSKENIIMLYDDIADVANNSFPDFMKKTFNTSLARGGIIKAGREYIASKGIFIKKKKYAVLMYDKEGTRLDVDGKLGKLKAMGLDLKRADTPKFMQQFLEKILMDVLTDVPKENIYKSIKEFRTAFKERPSWEKGSPKKVSALSDYTEKLDRSNSRGLTGSLQKGEKANVNLPGHVRASINWNNLLGTYKDRYSLRIGDGSKVIVCKLKKNIMGLTSVAYPIDEMHLPQWFKDLPFSDSEMENTIIDMKLDNMIGVLGWDLTDTKEIPATDFFVFS